ncbi:DMT family transporter [Candidatus Thorarchaeota archaeon]|nr:MAG: DMT family transporter [Candidatus Thorarchaeota archaeon]
MCPTRHWSLNIMGNRNLKYYGGLMIAMVAWGGSWVSAKVVVDIAPPMTIGFFRFLIAAFLFVVTLKISQGSVQNLLNRQNIKAFLLLGTTGIFGYGVLFLTGMRFTTAAQGSIIAGFNPVTTSIFAAIIHKEKLVRKWQYVGFALSFAGVIFVVGVQSLLDFRLDYLIGNLIILGGMILWGLYSSIGKETMKKISPLEANAGGTIVGALLFGTAMIFEKPWNLSSFTNVLFWSNVAYLGVAVTFVGFLLYFISVKEIGATQSGGFINFVPVFGTLFSLLLLQEPFYWTFLVGLLLVISGVGIINFSPPKSSKQRNP